MSLQGIGKACSKALVLLASIVIAGPAASATITWADWTSITTNSAAGSIGGNAVTWSGPNIGGITTGTFGWGPASTYVGGVVGNPPCTGPSCVGDIVHMNQGAVTLSFASAITNPVFAIWSLGSPSIPSTLTFAGAVAPSIQSTGPNASFGFVSLTAAGNVVSGREGNGTFLIPGTFNSLSFTGTFENFYGLTVGTAGAITAPIPEPGTLALLASGLLAVAGIGRKKLGKR